MTAVEAIRSKSDLLKVEQTLLKQNFRNYVLFKIGINMGLRISDILALDIKDVREKDVIDIVEKKMGKRRSIPINTTLKPILAKYTKDKNDNEPLFLSKKGNRMERTFVYKIINNACKMANLKNKIGTHTMRKTFGYHYYQKYKDVAMLQKIFNHSSPAITLRYIGITQEEIYNSYLNFVL